MKKSSFYGFTFFVFLVFYNFLYSQELSGKYFARAIAYYPTAIPVGEISKPIAEHNLRYLALLLEKQIKLARFYWESLPDEVIVNFAKVRVEKEYKSISELTQDVEQYIMPEIIRILDINKELRALSLLTEVERNTFIATKAKSLGIPAEKVERIMNSSYVVVPYVGGYLSQLDTITVTEKKDNEEKKIKIPIVKVAIQGGLIFFRVYYQNNQYSIRPEMVIEGEGKSNFAIKDANVSAAEDTAFANASLDVVYNFELTVRNLFKLSAQISEVGFNRVSFPLGRNEGIGIDDGFDVIEFVQQPNGEIVPKNVGFVRVVKVADNTKRRNEYSEAQIIIGGIFAGKIERGMIVEERPRFPFDFVFGMSLLPVRIKTGKFKLNESAVSNDTLEITSSGKFAYTFQFNINSNYGRLTGTQVSQFWITLGANVGFIPIKAKFFEENVRSAVFASFNYGFMKKIYFRRLALSLGSNLTLSNFRFSIDKKTRTDTISYALSPRAWFWGVGAGFGVEFVLNPDLNIGAKAFYHASTKSSDWSFLKKEDNKEIRRKIKFSNVSLSGLMFQFYINVSVKNFAKVRKFS